MLTSSLCVYGKDNLSLLAMTNSRTYTPGKVCSVVKLQGLGKGKVDTLGNTSARLNRRLG